ncbi:hypothetical protein MRB53_002688 [Persea americana]|uniref:Uncharacterized protein n=1 Tax=Persea americana TaxID=3435 RepID=A0ACC2MVI5_PERAE|nr:hypothetical protein MRB53_002688 [Persea americana]
MTVPCGYRFHPRDEELLVYQKRKIHNLPLPSDIINEVELYKYDPSDLIGRFLSKGEEKCYFFTPTYRKYLNGSRPNRSTNNGYWKTSTAGTQLDEWVLCSVYENLSGDKREKRKRKATEELDTRTEKRALVVQEPISQINEYKANDQHVVSSYDILDQKEPIHDASDIGLMSDSDFAKLMEKMATEEVGTKREERIALVQQEHHQSVVFSADYLEDIISWDIPPMSDSDFADLAKLMEVMTGEELDRRSEINVVQQGPQINISENEDNGQSVFFSYDDLQKVPIFDASDILSWDIPPISDSNFDDLAELMRAGEELDTRSEITMVQQGPQIKTGENKDTHQSVFFSYDDLQKLPILDASDMVGWDIPPMSDSDFTAGEELDTSNEITCNTLSRVN